MLHFVLPSALVVAPAAIAFLVWARRSTFIGLSPLRRGLITATRILLLLLVTVALARPTVLWPSRHAPVALLIDVSSSMSAQRLEAARRFAAQAWAGRGSTPFEVVTFGRHPRRAAISASGPRIERHDADDTDLAEAITFARGLFAGAAPRLVLLTDGNGTRGDALKAVARAAQDGCQIDWADLGSAQVLDARIVDIRLPETLRRQEPAQAHVVVEATARGSATLRFDENSLLVKELPRLELRPGRQTFVVDFEPSVSGLVRYGATVVLAGDEVTGNDQFVQFAQVAGPPRVLLAARTPAEGVHLEEALAVQDINVETVAPSALPSTLEGLLPYDTVIVAGVAAVELDRLRQAALASYVRDSGGGLVFVSGRNGLRRDPDARDQVMASVLPVELSNPSERQDPPVALALLIDRSGSMVGEKLDYAKQAALAVIDKLSANDQLGVLAFDARYQWILPLAPLRDKAAVKATVSSLGAGGGTKFAPALEEAYYALGSAEAAVRHVILLTDGVSTDPNIFDELVGKMHAGSVTVSTVAIGSGADVQLLRTIARIGQGRFSLATSAREVPNIFVKETEAAQSDALQHTKTRAVLAAPARELGGIDFGAAPPLDGYVRTRAKATAEVLLETPRKDPLLARWRFGLGQVIAFTSDATTAWATSWITSRWEGFGKLWSQLVRSAQRNRPRNDLDLALEVREDRLFLKVLATDAQGRFLDDLEVTARVIVGAQRSYELTLPQTGPGRYAAELDVPPGNILALATAIHAGRRFEGRWTPLARPYPVELAQVQPNQEFFSMLARVGHGQAIDAAQVASPTQVGLPRAIPLLPALALLAAVLFVVELAVKRARYERRS